MANVKQIKINDTVYDVEDSVARSALEQKAPLESPALTGIPTAPTASNGTSTTQIATTAFVQNAVQGAGGSYTLPVASSTTLGGVKPVAKTASMTQEVGVDVSGALYTEPGSGGGGSTDISLGITGAAAGKIPKIKAVDAVGKPTEWEATALPNEAFIVYFTLERPLVGDPIITSDRTPEEVIAAITAKKQVIALLDENNTITQLCSIANTSNNLYFYTIGDGGDVVGIGWEIEIDIEGGTTYTLTTMAPWNFIGYNGVSGPYQIFGTGELGGYEFKQHIMFENLPEVTASDNGKFMRVVNGAWKAAELLSAGGASF